MLYNFNVIITYNYYDALFYDFNNLQKMHLKKKEFQIA